MVFGNYTIVKITSNRHALNLVDMNLLSLNFCWYFKMQHYHNAIIPNYHTVAN